MVGHGIGFQSISKDISAQLRQPERKPSTLEPRVTGDQDFSVFVYTTRNILHYRPCRNKSILKAPGVIVPFGKILEPPI